MPIAYHGKAVTIDPLASPAHYKIVLILNELSFNAGPATTTLTLMNQILEDHKLRAGIKMVQGIPIPIPDIALGAQKNPVYFNAPVIPGRTYRLTLRVEIEAKGIPIQGHLNAAANGSLVNFMDKAMIISEAQRVDGYIKWGPVKLRIHP